MRDGTRVGLLVLGAAAVLGLLGDLLLRAIPWGLNAPIWILALIVAAGALLYAAKLPLLGGGRWLGLAALLFACGIALRDSTALLMVNLLAVLLCLGLAAHRADGGWPRLGGLPQYVIALVSAGLHACGGALVLAAYDVRWKEVPRTGWSAAALATLRGLLIAIPLVLVFGALFMAADAVFSGLVTSLFAIDVPELFSHLLLLGIWGWLAAGYLRQLLFCTVAVPKVVPESDLTPPAHHPTMGPLDPHGLSGAERGEPDTGGLGLGLARAGTPKPAPTGHSDVGAGFHQHPNRSSPAPNLPRPGGRVGVLGIVELTIVLGLLDALFLAFVVVQFRYLFGGAELVQVSETLTYADYARRGFFELVWVAALLLPTVLLLDWLAKLDSPRTVTAYRALAGLLVVLLFVVIASALQRMLLYTQEYGLTELRLYTTAFMFWIASVGVWYLATVLRDRRERFLFGALVSGLVVAGILNAINPDDLIVRANAARHDAPARFDGAYTMRLSADAGPALIEVLPHIPEYQRVMVARRLLQDWESAEQLDWRSWNYGRWRSLQATAANEATLREAAALPVPSSR